MAVVALSVIEPRHAAFVLVRNREASLGFQKRNQFGTGEGVEGEAPSDDPLVMLTAQQLSASLQLRLAVTGMTPALYGCKQATALNLSSCLERLDEKQKLLDDYLRSTEVASEILSRCTGADLSVTSPSSSSSSKQAGVVFAIASSIASELRSGVHKVSSRSADHRLHSNYSPQGGRGVLQKSQSSLHPWTPLLDALALFDDSSQNWSLHRAAFEGVVKERIMEIPSALVESYRSAGGDMAFLLRLLMSHGYLLDVCRFATSLVQSRGESINQPCSDSSSSSSKCRLPLPYTVIDAVITSCKTYLSQTLEHVTSVELYKEHEIMRKVLRTGVTLLENAIRQHFKRILAAEIKS